jgi:phosphate starvation-inducible protein PhoH and related proteins
LTRLGFNSKAVITGDITQIDLPPERRSGLVEAIEIVAKIEGISMVYFDERDVVRHTLVQRIIKAYDEHGSSRQEPRQDQQGSRGPRALGRSREGQHRVS